MPNCNSECDGVTEMRIEQRQRIGGLGFDALINENVGATGVKKLGNHALIECVSTDTFRYIDTVEKEKPDDRRERVVLDLVAKYRDHPLVGQNMDKFRDKKRGGYRHPSDAEHQVLFLDINAGVKLYETLYNETATPSPDQVTVLALAAAARQAVMVCNQSLVVHAAQNMPSTYSAAIEKGKLDIEDIYQMGNAGLARAIIKFDVSRGYKFSTYAFTWIQRAIQKSYHDVSQTIRVPEYLAVKNRSIEMCVRKMKSSQNRYPTDEEIIEATGVSQTELSRIRSIHTVSSLNEAVNDENRTEVGDMLASDEEPIDQQVVNTVFREQTKSVINAAELTDIEKIVVGNRYGIVLDNGKDLPLIGASLTELAKWLKCELIDVRRIERSALKKLAPHADSLRS